MKKLIFVLMSALVVLGVVYSAQKDWGNNVSFEMVISRDGQPKTTCKMWIKGDDMRMETTERDDQGNTREVITIILNSKNVMYVYYPGENTAMKMKLVAQGDSLGRDSTKSPAPTISPSKI